EGSGHAGNITRNAYYRQGIQGDRSAGRRLLGHGRIVVVPLGAAAVQLGQIRLRERMNGRRRGSRAEGGTEPVPFTEARLRTASKPVVTARSAAAPKSAATGRASSVGMARGTPAGT